MGSENKKYTYPELMAKFFPHITDDDMDENAKCPICGKPLIEPETTAITGLVLHLTPEQLEDTIKKVLVSLLLGRI